MIVALALSPGLDVTYEVDALALGGITRPSAVTRVAGGKALNVARAAAGLGADVHALAVLGGPTGEWVAALLADDGVPATVVAGTGTTRTCLTIVEASGGATSTDLYEPATELDRASWASFARAARDRAAARPGGWFALSGSIPRGVPLDELAGLLVELRAAGARVVVDGSGAGLRATAGAADLVKVNRHEAEELVGAPLATATEAGRALRERLGVDSVVTDGVYGAAALLGGAELLAPPTRRPGRFPAGSGDAFLGGLLTALDRGDAYDAALALAVSAAERNAHVPGQGRLAPEPQT